MADKKIVDEDDYSEGGISPPGPFDNRKKMLKKNGGDNDDDDEMMGSKMIQTCEPHLTKSQTAYKSCARRIQLSPGTRVIRKTPKPESTEVEKDIEESLDEKIEKMVEARIGSLIKSRMIGNGMTNGDILPEQEEAAAATTVISEPTIIDLIADGIERVSGMQDVTFDVQFEFTLNDLVGEDGNIGTRPWILSSIGKERLFEKEAKLLRIYKVKLCSYGTDCPLALCITAPDILPNRKADRFGNRYAIRIESETDSNLPNPIKGVPILSNKNIITEYPIDENTIQWLGKNVDDVEYGITFDENEDVKMIPATNPFFEVFLKQSNQEMPEEIENPENFFITLPAMIANEIITGLKKMILGTNQGIINANKFAFYLRPAIPTTKTQLDDDPAMERVTLDDLVGNRTWLQRDAIFTAHVGLRLKFEILM